jgi:D-arabinose 1-dehydrogenase-like Zn-dependent alcohol dehydrogenase
MCGTDGHVHHGNFGLTPPIVAGHEPAGEVVAVGPGVIDLKVGDRVGTFWTQRGCGRCAACQSGMVRACSKSESWIALGGGNSELMLAWESGCALIPDGVPFEIASPIFCAGYTVVSGLRNADLRPGDRVAVLGVGGLGHLAVQYAKALGLETFALTGQADKKKELLALGADEVLVTGPDPGQVLLDAGGADVILSTTNAAKQIGAAAGGLRRNGRLISMGVADGPIPIDSRALMAGQKQVRGSSQDERADLFEALALVARGKVKPIVELYPLEKVNDALERMLSGKVRYRAVLQHAA